MSRDNNKLLINKKVLQIIRFSTSSTLGSQTKSSVDLTLWNRTKRLRKENKLNKSKVNRWYLAINGLQLHAILVIQCQVEVWSCSRSFQALHQPDRTPANCVRHTDIHRWHHRCEVLGTNSTAQKKPPSVLWTKSTWLRKEVKQSR